MLPADAILFGVFDGKESIIDFKTSTHAKKEVDIDDYFLQETFYAISHNEMFSTNIEQIVTLMAVENGMPMIWKKPVTYNHAELLINRIDKFYSTLRI